MSQLLQLLLGQSEHERRNRIIHSYIRGNIDRWEVFP